METANRAHPSHALYQSLLMAYEHFNAALFDNALPPVIFTVQRQKDLLGYFAPERWASPDGERCHEIAINPAHMGQSRLIDVLQTLVHEMVHCWQHCHGNPGRASYHNKEWARKMIAVGLQPSSTGAPGGQTTGQQMSDYPIENGPFLQACHMLVKERAFSLPWIYRLAIAPPIPGGVELADAPTLEAAALSHHSPAATQPDDACLQIEKPFQTDPDSYLFSTYSELLPKDTFIHPAQARKPKTKYQCASCQSNVWGKPGLNILCADCQLRFDEHRQ